MLATREAHRGRQLPARLSGAEIQQLRVGGRDVATTDVDDFVDVIKHRRGVIALRAVALGRQVAPSSGRGVEGSGLRQRAGDHDRASGGEMHAPIQVKGAMRRGWELGQRAAFEDLRDLVVECLTVGPAIGARQDEHASVLERRQRWIPATIVHGRARRPRVRGRIIDDCRAKAALSARCPPATSSRPWASHACPLQNRLALVPSASFGWVSPPSSWSRDRVRRGCTSPAAPGAGSAACNRLGGETSSDWSGASRRPHISTRSLISTWAWTATLGRSNGGSQRPRTAAVSIRNANGRTAPRPRRRRSLRSSRQWRAPGTSCHGRRKQCAGSRRP